MYIGFRISDALDQNLCSLPHLQTLLLSACHIKACYVEIRDLAVFE
jgi:hypothetical protein